MSLFTTRERRHAGGSNSIVTVDAPASSSDETYRRSLRGRGCTNPWHLCAGSQVEAGARENGIARIANLWRLREYSWPAHQDAPGERSSKFGDGGIPASELMDRYEWSNPPQLCTESL